MKRKNKYCCEEHIDEGIDDFIVETETFPNLNESAGEKCDYCENDAVYSLD